MTFPALALVTEPFSALVFALLAGPWFYLALLPVLYWTASRAIALRLGVLVMLAGFFGSLLQRYWLVEGKVALLVSAAFWLFAMSALKNRFWLLLAIAVPGCLAGLSFLAGSWRAVSGIFSLLAGWGFGAVCLVPGRQLLDRLERVNFRVAIGLAALLSFCMNLAGLADTGLSGLFLGLVAGATLLPRRLDFRPAAGGLGQKLCRFVLGIVPLLALALAGRYAQALTGAQLLVLARFVYTFAAGFWISYGAPLVFSATRCLIRP